ncbi:hypothetical protein J7J83_00335 [bacterium]|nr:hypothetical protein [bacterium]
MKRSKNKNKMDSSTENNNHHKEKNSQYVGEWLNRKGPRDLEPLPLERAITNELANQVIEDESTKWDTIREIAGNFNKLGDDLETFIENFLFQEDLKNPYRKDAQKRVASHIQNLISRIEEENIKLNSYRDIVGDIVTTLLRHSLNILKERASKIHDATVKGNPVSVNNSYKSFENYRNKFFSELSQILFIFANDPFARAEAGPFEKEMTDVIFDALKIPAIPENMLAEYIQRDDTKTDEETFRKDYEFFMNIELGLHKQELHEEIYINRKELEMQLETSTNSPRLKDFLTNELNYWEKMTPEKRYKQLLRMRIFELLETSAGEKRLTPELMYKFYSKIRFM